MGRQFSYLSIFRSQKRKLFKHTREDGVSGYKILRVVDTWDHPNRCPRTSLHMSTRGVFPAGSLSVPQAEQTRKHHQALVLLYIQIASLSPMLSALPSCREQVTPLTESMSLWVWYGSSRPTYRGTQLCKATVEWGWRKRKPTPWDIGQLHRQQERPGLLTPSPQSQFQIYLLFSVWLWANSLSFCNTGMMMIILEPSSVDRADMLFQQEEKMPQVTWAFQTAKRQWNNSG